MAISETSRQERVKSWATWLNNMSVACFTVGVLGPFFSALGSGANPDQQQLNAIAVELPGFLLHTGRGQIIDLLLLACILLRLAARQTLRTLN